MSRAKAQAREMRHARWLERTLAQRARGEMSRQDAEWVRDVNRSNAQHRLKEQQLMESTREFCREANDTLDELVADLPTGWRGESPIESMERDAT